MALEIESKIGHPPPEYVLLKLKGPEEKTKGGIILTRETADYDAAADCEGIVVEVGEFCWKEGAGDKPWVKVGDKVWFSKYQGDHYVSGEKHYRVIPYYSIRMILPKEEF
jgi:co-chaperonin GroES (HSP10)